MKKGVILYVTEGRELLHEGLDLREEQDLLGVDAVCLATSESEIAFNWWHLLTRGMQEISCMRAVYSEATGAVEPQGHALRLCG